MIYSSDTHLSTYVNLDLEFVFALAVVFVYVCLEVVDFSMMFFYWDFVEPIRYGVRDVYAGFWGWFIMGGSFIC